MSYIRNLFDKPMFGSQQVGGKRGKTKKNNKKSNKRTMRLAMKRYQTMSRSRTRQISGGYNSHYSVGSANLSLSALANPPPIRIAGCAK
jgi:hypothetical protein